MKILKRYQGLWGITRLTATLSVVLSSFEGSPLLKCFLSLKCFLRHFWGVLIASEWIWKIPERSEGFSDAVRCSEAFSCVLIGSETFLKVLRHSLTIWDLLSCSKAFSNILISSVLSLKDYESPEEFHDILGCSDLFWGILMESKWLQ